MRLECGFVGDQPNQPWKGSINHMAAEAVQFSTMPQYTCQVCVQNTIAADNGPACTYQFESMQDLFHHYQAAHINLLRYCGLCSEMFTNTYRWLKHLKKKHCFNRDNYLEANTCVIFQNQCECCMETLGGQGEVSFEQFQEHFLSTSSLPKHFSTLLVYKCSLCCSLFKSDMDLDLHRKTCDTEKILAEPPKKIAKISNHPFFAEEFNQKENNIKMTDMIPNGFCWKGERGQRNENSIRSSQFLLGAWRNLTRELYQPHHQLLTPRPREKVSDNSSMQKCRHCNKNVSSEVLAHHEKNCFYNTKRRCKTCFQSCSTKASLLDHGHRHLQEEYRICLFCQNIPLREGEVLGEHIRTVHTNDVEDFPFSCPICRLVLINRRMLEMHFEFHHSPLMYGDQEDEDACELSNPTPFAESFKCTKCDQKFTSLRMWTTHTKFAHPAAAVSNGTSTSTASQNEDSEQASEKRARYADSFICPKCDQKFVSFRMWAVHTKFAHTTVKIINRTSTTANASEK